MAAPPSGEEKEPAVLGEQKVSMDFENVDIHTIIKYMSELTGKNFIVDRRVTGKVTAHSPTKLTKDEAMQAFKVILEVNNFSLVPTSIKNEYKIVPFTEGRRGNIPVSAGKKQQKASEEMITQIIPIENASAPELAKLLSGLISPQGLINIYTPSNTLIITASRSSINKILHIINQVDQATFAPQLVVYPMVHGNARNVAQNISRLMTAMNAQNAKTGQKSIALVQADERTNSVVALGDRMSLETIERMVKSLDIPTPQGKNDIHLINLENADATSVAEVLNELIAYPQISSVDGKRTTKVLSRDIMVVADKATNSLIIMARPDEITTLKETINQLDVLRKQVFIEALIIEVSATDSFSFGVNWAYGDQSDGDTGFVSSNFGGGSVGAVDIGNSQNLISFPTGGSIGAIFNDIVNIGGTIYSIQAILSAIQNNDGYSILSTPQLLTLDNEEASIEIVDNIPFITQTTTSATVSDYLSQNIDYRDVGVKLNITPQIGDKGTLRLKVEQEVSRVVSSTVSLSGTSYLAPTTKKRNIKSVIQMKDGQTAVIAGLISEDSAENISKVPVLGDIPLLGWLFKSKQTSTEKTNLFIFISPKVISSYEDSEKLSLAKKAYFDGLDAADDAFKMAPVPAMQPAVIYPASRK